MKVIVIGGNQGGLAMTYTLGKLGFDVKCFEKKAKDKVAYEWTDDVNASIFSSLGLPMPDEKIYFPKKNWCFVSPSEKVRFASTGVSPDVSVERRPLNDYFYNLAKEVGSVSYEKAVDRLIIENDAVKGVVVGEERLLADLVVDCSGVFSKFRQSLPEAFHIQKMPAADEVFVTYRGLHQWKDGEPAPKYSNKVYMRHLFEDGISWCVAEDDHTVNVLIGRIGNLDPDTLDNALNRLMNDNPILTKTCVREGHITHIPVRYPVSRMVANGYVLAGDSAFMTIPLLGSGIYNSLYCAKILAEVLAKNPSAEIGNLWNYQREYFKEIGGGCAAIDVLKRWMLSIDAEDLDFLFTSGVLDEATMSAGSNGSVPAMTPSLLIKKAWQGRKRLGVLLKFSEVVKKSKLVSELTKRDIPDKFDEKKVIDWQNSLDAIYKG